MKHLLIKHSVVNTLMIMLLWSSSAVFADDCRTVLNDAKSKVAKIEAALTKINNQKDYQLNVQNRYEIVNDLLYSTKLCDESKMSYTHAQSMHTLRSNLSSLQASAQSSAFTKFSDWITAKELDLGLCRQITVANTTKEP